MYGLALDNPYPAYYSFYGAQFDHVLDSHNLNTTGPIPWMPSRAGDYAISWIATINTTVCGMTPSQTDILLATIHVRSALHKGSPCNGTLAGGSELPASGLGYYHHLGTDPPGTDDWGGAEAMLTLIANVGASWNALHQAPNVGVGDISRNGGGSFPPHNCHQNGRDADIRYLRADAQDLPLDLTTDPSAYSRELTLELLNMIAATGVVSEIIVDPAASISPSDVGGTTIVIDNSGEHRNHFHVEIDDPDGDDANQC